MDKLKKIIAAVLALTLVFSFTGCGTDSPEDSAAGTTAEGNNAASQNNAIGSISTNDNSEEHGRAGNANYNIANGGWIDEEAGWLYYGLKDGLYKCKEDGSQKEKLLDDEGGVYSINVIDDWVYFRNLGIYRVKTDGTGYEQVAGEDERGGVHFVDGKIYNSSEYRMNYDGSDKEHIYVKNSASGYTLNIVGGWIYFSDKDQFDKSDHIYKMRLDGSDLQSIFDGYTAYMIVDGDWIYFSNYKDNSYLYKMKSDGTELQLLVDTKITQILVNDGWVYYTSGGIYKIKTDGTENQLLCEDSGDELQLHGEWLYYKGAGDAVYRVKIDGTEQQFFADVGEVELSAKDDSSNEVSIGKVELIRSYETKYGEENAVTYPSYIIEYPSNWMVKSTDVTPITETIILSNARGVEIKYSYIGGTIGGFSAVSMSRVEVSLVDDSQFIPASLQGEDYSSLGKFVVAKLKVTGQLNMLTDSEFTDVDGAVSYAVVPETRIGIDEGVRGPYEGAFAFQYGGYVSLIASAPDGQFTAQEEAEVIAILSSFRIAN